VVKDCKGYCLAIGIIDLGSVMTSWINTMFGVNLSPTLSFILLFAAIITGVLLLIWIARRLLGGTFVSGGRGRHLRLAVMDATPVDSRRRLVLVRRDDVEHLILIGGPTDVVVEQNIRIDGPRETRSTQTSAEPAAQERPVEAARPPEPPRPEAARAASAVTPMAPRPAPQPATAQNVPPRPPMPPREITPQRPALPTRGPMAAVQPFQQPVRPPSPSSAPAVNPPHPFTSAPRTDPAATALPPRAEPVLPLTPPPPAAPAPASPLKHTDQDLDDSLIADLSESLTFEDEEIAPEVSLQKEMESLLGTLDVKKDRIS
jgi:flagellar biogenesis protein FliO